MSFLRLALCGLRYHRRAHAGLLIGVMLASTILTGAMLVGDSINQSLRDIASARLGRVAYAMRWGNRFFEQRLASRIQEKDARLHVEAALDLPGTIALPPAQRTEQRQLNQVRVLGVEKRFWDFAPNPAACSFSLGPQEAAINEKVAQALGVRVRDNLTLRVSKHGLMPQDAPLASREKDLTTSRLVTVKAILTDEQLGRFSLSTNQITPFNVFVDRAWLQEQSDLANLANLLLTDEMSGFTPNALQAILDQAWQLEDIGLRLRAHPSGLVQLESTRIFLEDEGIRAAMDIPGAMATLTYLVESISKGDRTTPYSFAEAGIVPPQMLGDDEVIINQWLADRLLAQPGDRITLTYLQLLASNAFEKQTHVFTVRSIMSMEDMRIERELSPHFPGLTDVESCANWSIGLPMDEARLKDSENEAYWKQYGQTPKLLTTLKAGQAMWGTRFGNVMTVRFPINSISETDLRDRLRKTIAPQRIGLQFIPVKQIAHDATAQATDLGGLFVGMSFFLIVSALILIGLLYVFNVQQRASEIGILLAMGFPVARIRTLFLLETVPTALIGAGLGGLLGLAYARMLMAALMRYWPGAIAGTNVRFHANPTLLVSGSLIAFLFAFIIVFVTTWRGTRRTPASLVSTDFTSQSVWTLRRKKRRYRIAFPILAFLAAMAIVINVIVTRPDQFIEPFFGVGALLLLAGFSSYAYLLDTLTWRQTFHRPALWKIAVTNLARRRGRSLSVAALTASGCFLVFAVSSMQENVGLHADKRSAGTGGFGVYAETTVPLTGTPQEIKNKLGADGVALKVHDGDDASCLNLNRAQMPRLLGVNVEAFATRGAFEKSPDEQGIWDLLNREWPDGVIPALVGDTDTALWGLKKKAGPVNGDIILYRDEVGREIKLKLVGCLPMRLSVFQGSLLIADTAFARLFPSEAGYRVFLMDAPPTLTARLNIDQERLGMTAVPAVDRLREFYAVESSYLTMFLVLGGLGLLLGIGGTGVVVLRNIFERRGELALLEAVGYSRSMLLRILFIEQAALVLAGAFLGTLAASAALIPLIVSSQSTVSPTSLLVFLAAILVTTFSSIGIVLGIGLRHVSIADLRVE